MELLSSLIMAVLGKFLGTEIEAWVPALAQRLLAKAVQRLPESARERYAEEWAAHLNESPGNLIKILHAIGCLRSAKAIIAASNLAEDRATVERAHKRNLPKPSDDEDRIEIADNVLGPLERRLFAALLLHVPANASPYHFTAIGLLGATLAASGFIACWFSNWFLLLVVAGLIANWLGESIDCILARHREIERLGYGYFLDNFTDIFARTLIIVGLGASPYFTVGSSLLMLSLYLLISSYSYLRVVTESVYRLSHGGIGATEFRILVACWALFAAWFGPSIATARSYGFVVLDIVIGGLSTLTLLGFVFVIQKALMRLQREKQ